MKKAILLTLVLFWSIGPASQFSYADTSGFAIRPEDSGQVWQGVYGTTPHHYGRNSFYNFNSSSGTPTHYYGFVDYAYPAGTFPGDAFTKDPAVSFASISNSTRLGLDGTASGKQSGSATFSVGNLDLASKDFPKYFYLEMDVTLRDGNASSDQRSSVSVSLAGTNALVVDSWAGTQGGIGSGVLDAANAPVRSGNTWTWAFGTASTQTRTVNAWFKLDQFASAETLTIDFVGGKGSTSGRAYLDNLHIATTPEPVSAALFLTGAGLMALRRCRRAASGSV